MAILVAAIATVYVGIITPALDFYHEREAMLDRDRTLEPRLRAVAAELPQLQARAAELRRSADTQHITLDGASDALASAGLQSRLEGLAAAAGVAIASTEVVPAEPRAEYRRIGLRIAVSGSYDSIVKLLGAIETTSPPLILDSLQIHGRHRVSSAATAPQMDAAFVVYGFRSTETAAVSKP